MNRPTVMDIIEDEPPRAEPWRLWVIAAFVISLLIHAGFLLWARQYTVVTFSDAYYEEMVPRAFKVDRVEIDARLLDEAEQAEPIRKITPAPVDLPREDISAEKPAPAPAPTTPGQLGITSEPVPVPGLPAAGNLPATPGGVSLEEDLNAMREALLADEPASSAQPAIELAAPAQGQPGSTGEGSVPAGYSNLDDLLSQTGGLTASQAPIFMPSDVLFGYDESFLRPEAITSLEKLGVLIRRNPGARFRIEGYTDSFGGQEYNTRLSLARAESVKEWLASQMGIDPARIDTRGLGHAKPLVPPTGSIEEQQPNRRVEIVILRPSGGQ
jgi:outer membrane protein OmpA-like peptidoglycan-associated protein